MQCYNYYAIYSPSKIIISTEVIDYKINFWLIYVRLWEVAYLEMGIIILVPKVS